MNSFYEHLSSFLSGRKDRIRSYGQLMTLNVEYQNLLKLIVVKTQISTTMYNT